MSEAPIMTTPSHAAVERGDCFERRHQDGTTVQLRIVGVELVPRIIVRRVVNAVEDRPPVVTESVLGAAELAAEISGMAFVLNSSAARDLPWPPPAEPDETPEATIDREAM